MLQLASYRTPTLAAAVVAALVTLTGVSPARADDDRGTIVDIALETPALSTLVEAVVKADLVDTLSGDGQFTVFAPTNDAFAALGIDPEEVDVDTLTAVLLDHVVEGRFSARRLERDARRARTREAIGGLQLIFTDPLTVNDIGLVVRDVRASNGIVHVIDGVLIGDPPTIVAKALGNPDLSTLVDAVVRADLVETLQGEGPFTVFAPSNAAFESFGIDPAATDVDTLTAVLLDHVVAGRFTERQLRRLAWRRGHIETLGGLLLDVRFRRGRLQVNGLDVEVANVTGSNGVVHVIDGVLLEAEEETAAERRLRRLARKLRRVFGRFFH